MTKGYFNGFINFISLDAGAPKIFGFSEFIAGLALMVLAWTIADIRYKFRVKTAPVPLQGLTFTIVAIIGILTLLTDLWRAEEWFVPQGNIISSGGWQALLGGIFLLTFLTWAWYSFIRPPIFNKRNAKRYAQELYRTIIKGAPSELSVIADEFSRSVLSILSYASNRDKLRIALQKRDNPSYTPPKLSITEAYANDILLLIADKRFCRSIIESSPGTALSIFKGIEDTKKYGVQIETFSENIVNEALSNENSFLYHEIDGYESGLIGYLKPLSNAMFSNHKMVENIGTFFDADIMGHSEWRATKWKAYCRIVLITLQNYVESSDGIHSTVLNRATGYIERATSNLYKLDGLDNITWNNEEYAKLRVVVDFIKNAVGILETKGIPKYIQLRIRKGQYSFTIYDQLANMIFEAICSASAVKSPKNQCWWIQHNSLWSELFSFERLNGDTAKIVKFKVRRLIYNEILEMKTFPNFKGAKILGFCLNVMGFRIREDKYDLDFKALHKAILSWTKKNFVFLYVYNPRVAEACLVDGITYDSEHRKLIKTFNAEGLRHDVEYIYFELDSFETTINT